MKNQNLFNRKSLKFFRSSLRNKSTSAEAELWNILKSKNLNARKFRRQYSIGNKIEKDRKRDQYLEGLGFSILRFENRLVFQEPEFVKNEIRKTFKRKDSEFE
jgi:very-short-patch-repair endonuclease